MALQNTDILLKAQEQALEGEKFQAWGDFAKERIGEDVAAIQKTLVERDKKYNESLASLESDIKAQRLLSGDDADIVKELEAQKDEFLGLKMSTSIFSLLYPTSILTLSLIHSGWLSSI